MLLNRITYHNFRPFIGDQEMLLYPESKDKNVTIILGENTFGKSTVVLSFIWCLYGESRFARPNDILNKKVEAQMRFGQQEDAYVEIEFEDDNKVYTIRRTQSFTKGANGSLTAGKSEASMTYVDESGQTKKIGPYQNDINLAIKAILPVDLSSFFFFEGEKNNEITRKDLGRSVRTLLGLEAFDRMRSHLYGSQTQSSPYSNSVMGYYLGKQNDESGELAKAEYQKKIDAEEALESIDKRIGELEEQIDSYDDKIESINDALRRAAPSKELQKRRDAIASELKGLEEDLARLNKRFLKGFGSRESFSLFVHPLLEKASKRLNEMDVADKGIKGIEAPAIHALLDRGRCLCGTELKPGTLAYNDVKKYIDFLPPKNVGTLVSEMLDLLSENEDKSLSFISDFEETYQDIQRCKQRINDLEKEDRDKLAEISQIGNVDTSEAEENLSNYKHRINTLREELDRKREEQTRKKTEIETAEKNFNMYKNKDSRAKQYHLYYRYAEAIYNWVNGHYAEQESMMRDRLNAYVTSLFNNMYSGHRDIYVDEKYNINMTVDGQVVDDTGGLRVIQYFAYVGGLVKLAYEVMQDRERDDGQKEQAMGEQYPLVLDAAFSHADQQHTKNIARELSKATSQLIFAVMLKDWLYAKDGLEGRIGRQYELQKIDETEVKIVEVTDNGGNN